jgi:signal transduction histidine kinase
MSGAISWRKLLAEAVPVFARDLDCVISNEHAVFTYTISDGIPSFSGRGDHHQEEYTKYKKSRTLTSPSLSGTGVSTYEVTFYPRRDFVERFTTATPIYAAVALVLVFFICTAVFIAYDVLMHRESDRQAAILDTKRRFVRFISHEIRTPLNTVRLGMKLFESELNFVASSIAKASPAEVVAVAKRALSSWRTLVDDILTNSETAVEVLDDLLNYDKIEVGSLRLEYSIFNIYELVKKTASVMQIQAQQKNILLEIVSPGHSPTGSSEQALAAAFMIGDSYRMSQVLRNLVSNALKFTPSGGHVSVTGTSST